MAAKGTGNTDRKNGMTNGLVIVQYGSSYFLQGSRCEAREISLGNPTLSVNIVNPS